MNKTADQLRADIALIERTLANTTDKNSEMAKVMQRNLLKYRESLAAIENTEKKKRTSGRYRETQRQR